MKREHVVLGLTGLLFLLYFFPVLLLDLAIVRSSFFTLREDLVMSLSAMFSSGDLALTDVARILTALLAGGLATSLRGETAERVGHYENVLLIGLGLALLVLFATYFAISLNESKIVEAYDDPAVAEGLTRWCKDRITETLVFLTLLLGLKKA